MNRLKPLLALVFKIALVGGCLVYAFSGVQWDRVVAAFGKVSLVKVSVAMLWIAINGPLVGYRLHFISDGLLSAIRGAWAAILCWGLNNVFPAKLGEVAKVAYLSMKSDLTLGRSFGTVFWERFSDINIMLLFGVAASAVYGVNTALVPLAITVAALWLIVGGLRFAPKTSEWFIARLPFDKLRRFFTDLKRQVGERLSLVFFIKLIGLGLCIWGVYWGIVHVCMNWVFDFRLTSEQSLVVFFLTAVGAAIPSVPGAVGVYEAAAVFGLKLYGVEGSEALTAAIILHMVQYIPATVGGFAVLFFSRMSVSDLKNHLRTPGKTS